MGEGTAKTGPRLGQLVAAGLVDSFGLALGWTVFVLHVVATQGLAAAGAYNAAMLAGIALSAPVISWLTARLDGRRLLQTTAVAEGSLRVGMFVLLLAGLPIPIVAAVVLLANITAWAGYAGMRAEVAIAAQERHRARALAWYVGCIAAVEAIGAATAALLPTGAGDTVTGTLLVAVIAFYAAVLLPTFVLARRAQVGRAPRLGTRAHVGRKALPLSGGFFVMLLASGPTILATAIAVKLHGRVWVAGAAAAFFVGALIAPLAASFLHGRRLPPSVVWPVLGMAMIAGWVVAPWSPVFLLAAQLLSGVSMTAFEGTMDAEVSEDDENVTAMLGWTAAARALGSAAAVAATPAVIATVGLSEFSLAAVIALGAAALLGLLGLAAHHLHGKPGRIADTVVGGLMPEPPLAFAGGIGGGASTYWSGTEDRSAPVHPSEPSRRRPTQRPRLRAVGGGEEAPGMLVSLPAPALSAVREDREAVARLDATIAASDARLSFLERSRPSAQAADATRHLLFLPSTAGYELVYRDGSPPAAGERVELAGRPGAYSVMRVGCSPLPNDRRPCAYLELDVRARRTRDDRPGERHPHAALVPSVVPTIDPDPGRGDAWRDDALERAAGDGSPMGAIVASRDER